MLLYEKGDAVRIEPRPPSPNTCRLCARSSRTLFEIPSERRRHPDAGRAQRVQSIIVSALLLIVGYAQTQAHSSSSTRGSSTRLTMAHIHRIVRHRCRTESSWLRAGRVWARTRPLQSGHAAAELVCRGRVVIVVLS